MDKLETEIKIKTEMLRRGLSAAEIGRRYDRHRVTIHQVIRGIAKSKYCRDAIARELEMSVSDLWPDEAHRTAA